MTSKQVLYVSAEQHLDSNVYDWRAWNTYRRHTTPQNVSSGDGHWEYRFLPEDPIPTPEIPTLQISGISDFGELLDSIWETVGIDPMYVKAMREQGFAVAGLRSERDLEEQVRESWSSARKAKPEDFAQLGGSWIIPAADRVGAQIYMRNITHLDKQQSINDRRELSLICVTAPKPYIFFSESRCEAAESTKCDISVLGSPLAIYALVAAGFSQECLTKVVAGEQRIHPAWHPSEHVIQILKREFNSTADGQFTYRTGFGTVTLAIKRKDYGAHQEIAELGFKQRENITETDAKMLEAIGATDEQIRDLYDGEVAEVSYFRIDSLIPEGKALADQRFDKPLAWQKQSSSLFLVQHSAQKQYALDVYRFSPDLDKNEVDWLIGSGFNFVSLVDLDRGQTVEFNSSHIRRHREDPNSSFSIHFGQGETNPGESPFIVNGTQMYYSTLYQKDAGGRRFYAQYVGISGKIGMTYFKLT